jgi:threonyl-tRNA synthetase
VQAVLIPIADRHIPYADEVAARLNAAGLRVEVDTSGDRMGNKIRKAQGQKVPYMLVIGDREMETGAVSLRLRSGEDRGAAPVEDFLRLALAEVDSKSNH